MDNSAKLSLGFTELGKSPVMDPRVPPEKHIILPNKEKPSSVTRSVF